MRIFRAVIAIVFVVGVMFTAATQAQDVSRDLSLGPNGSLDVVNNYGRVSVRAIAATKDDKSPPKGKLTMSGPKGVSDNELKLSGGEGRVSAFVKTDDPRKRIDVTITVPERVRLRVETRTGEIELSGNFAEITTKTETGTIVTDIPDDSIEYKLLWTESHPRYVADFLLEDIKERTAGRFEIRGTYNGKKGDAAKKGKGDGDNDEPDAGPDPKPKKKVKKGDPPPKQDDPDPASDDPGKKQDETDAAADDATSKSVSLNFTTARGIILLNVPPNEVGSDLQERPLTEAAKAIVRSGDSLLMDAIRRSAPKYYGDYMRSLPPIKREPKFTDRRTDVDSPDAQTKTALVRVTDLNNRAIAGLEPEDFIVTESGETREVISVTQSTAPFNLVLLLDVSGSVENYVNFIRKAARAFVETVDKNDRVSIIIFNEDVKVLSKFTTDKGKLSTSLDTFDAGGGTAYYDALAYTVADTLRPLRGERSALVVLTDGDDNRSFLPFESLMGSIQESGALIYPLYVPSGLIAAAATGQNADIDPMRKKYMSLSAKSQGEGERLARVSGGVYYPISQIGQIQRAYTDIVSQLRSAYNITYRSNLGIVGSGVSPRLKIKAKRDNAYTTITSVVPAK